MLLKKKKETEMKHCLIPRGKFVILQRLEIPDDALEVSVKKQLSWLSLLQKLDENLVWEFET